MTNDNYSGPEWSADEWNKAWTIKVGKAYLCEECGIMTMVTKGGLGVMEPKCCGKDMKIIERPDDEVR